jgi:hypothetical protein
VERRRNTCQGKLKKTTTKPRNAHKHLVEGEGEEEEEEEESDLFSD